MPSPAPSSSPSPLPPPAPSSSRRQRRLRQLFPPPSSSSATSSSSSSGSSSGLSFPSFSPAPSPFHHRFLSPLRSSAVPFSWEHRPGIPKTPARQRNKHAAKALPLPLPPSLLSGGKLGQVAADPFASAADAEGYFIVSEDAKTSARWRRRRTQKQKQQRRAPALAATLTDLFAVLSLYRSCTRSRDCVIAGTTPRPRSSPVARSPAKAAAA